MCQTSYNVVHQYRGHIMPHKISFVIYLYGQICYHGNKRNNRKFLEICPSSTIAVILKIQMFCIMKIVRIIMWRFLFVGSFLANMHGSSYFLTLGFCSEMPIFASFEMRHLYFCTHQISTNEHSEMRFSIRKYLPHLQSRTTVCGVELATREIQLSM